MYFDREDIPSDVLEEMHDERRRRARLNHWCDLCHGHTGAGSPCAIDDDEPEDEDDSPYCQCNAEPTVSELEDGRCDACGKEIA